VRSVCLEEFLRRAALPAWLRLGWVGFASRLRLAVGRRLTSPSLGGRPQFSTAAGQLCSTAKLAIDVRFGSKADIEARPVNVRFTPESGRRLSVSARPLSAKSGIIELESLGRDIWQ